MYSASFITVKVSVFVGHVLKDVLSGAWFILFYQPTTRTLKGSSELSLSSIDTVQLFHK